MTNHTTTPIKKPIGPKGIPLVGSAFSMARDPIGFLTNISKNYKPMAWFKFGFLEVYALSHPDLICHVLQTNNKAYQKGTQYKHLKDFLGNGLVTSEGDFWLRQRRLAQPAFHKARLSSFVDTMNSYTNRMIEEWQTKEKNNEFINIHFEMMRLTLAIVGKTLLSKDLIGKSKIVGESLSYIIYSIDRRTSSVINLPLWVPLPGLIRLRKHLENLDNVINSLIDERTNSQSNPDDLLNMLMEVQDADSGEKMSPKQLRDEVMTVFSAGHETTANALTFCFYLLSQNPEIENKLLDELKNVLNGKTPTFEDVPKLKYTLQVIEESMRLYPPVWFIARKAIESDEIDGYTVKPGSDVFISPYVIHHDPEFWPNPEKFDPERFTPENKAKQNKFAYFPFGGGPRFCIGSNFALMEMQIILAHVFQQFHLKVKEGIKLEVSPQITLRPKNGMWMSLQKRN